MNRTTFSTLTDLAARQLAVAAGLLADFRAAEPRSGLPGTGLADAVTAHADLSSALVDLGGTIRGTACRRRDSADSRVLAALDERSRRTPWAEPGEAVPPHTAGGAVAGHVRSAARCIRAASDLWATHLGHAGAPRSPEGARLRHPSFLGAALRHWRALIAAAGEIAEALATLASGPGVDPRLLVAVRDYPTPPGVPDRPPAVALPLARPTPRRVGDPLLEISDRIDRIHRHVWELDRADRVSAAVLINVAGIGTLLARAAEHAHTAGALGGADAADRAARAAGADAAQRQLQAWSGVAAHVGPLRSPDGPTILQVERLDLARLAERALGAQYDLGARRDRQHDHSRHCADAHEAERVPAPVGRHLLDACLEFAQVAEPCARSVRRLQQQGRLYMVGRAVPREVLARRPDLLAARLSDRIVAAPTSVARRLESQLHAVAASSPTRLRVPAA